MLLSEGLPQSKHLPDFLDGTRFSPRDSINAESLGWAEAFVQRIPPPLNCLSYA